jgi:sulfur-oxidizing protein SoxY
LEYLLNSTASIAKRVQDSTRRRLLKISAYGFAVLALSWTRTVLAKRPVAAFAAESAEATLNTLRGEMDLIASDEIKIVAADIAENGAVVPIKITTGGLKAESISIVASKNPVPLVAKFVLLGHATQGIDTRIKLAASCDIIVVVEAENRCYVARKGIEVTTSSCGA